MSVNFNGKRKQAFKYYNYNCTQFMKTELFTLRK